MTSSDQSPPAPDLRVLQANERTLLAWVRTGVALMAFGFVVARAGAWLRYLAPERAAGGGHFAWVGVAFVALGTLATAVSSLQHMRLRRAIVAGRPIIPSPLGVVVAALVSLIGLFLVAMLFARGGL